MSAKDSRTRPPLPAGGHANPPGAEPAAGTGSVSGDPGAAAYDARKPALRRNADVGQARPSAAELRLSRVVLEGDTGPSLPAFLEADREQAIADIASEACFVPLALKPDQWGAASFVLRLSIRDGRLIFDVRDYRDAPLMAIGLSLGPFRRLIKDYHLLVDSHMKAVEEGREARIQAIDMGRRGLHNEGASLMMRRLHGKVAIDFETARRLFTLVCILHQRVSAR
jgi:uncharacterized protein (UPF0262 family)